MHLVIETKENIDTKIYHSEFSEREKDFYIKYLCMIGNGNFQFLFDLINKSTLCEN